MTIWNQLTDDQLALIGCGAALAVAFCVMAVSYHVGRFVRGEQPAAHRPENTALPANLEVDRRRAA